QWLSLPLQLGFYIGLFIACDRLVSWLHLPLPANIVGMLLLLALIVTRIVPLNWVKAGSRWLLAEMLLFFIPAVVAVVNYGDLLRVDGWRICVVIGVSTLLVLVALLLLTHISWQDYIAENHWLLWLLGPATLAFAVPVYENVEIIKRHWLSLSAGVVTATLVAVCSSVWLARLLTLPESIQRSLAVRSITTPFALAAAGPIGGQPDLVALFVVITGVFGMAIGDVLFLRLAIKQGVAKGAGFGAASHGAGTARAYQIGEQEGVVASLVMMLSGVVTVVLAPLIGHLMWTI
ncbi:unnamed protein product, partial [Penicillium salamii]